MKASRFVFAMVSAAVLIAGVGCGNDQGDPAPPVNPGTPPVTGEDLKREFGEAADTALRYTEEQTTQLREKVRQQLTEMDAEMARMKAKTDELAGEAKTRMESRLSELSEERAKVEAKLQELGDSTGKAWTEVKSGLDKAWGEMKASYEKAADEFRSAPKE